MEESTKCLTTVQVAVSTSTFSLFLWDYRVDYKLLLQLSDMCTLHKDIHSLCIKLLQSSSFVLTNIAAIPLSISARALMRQGTAIQ